MVILYVGFVLAEKYRILKPLGKGGEGSVWLSIHLQTEQLWAVKEISKRKEGQETHELNMMKKLHHPSLPRILDVCESEDFVYLIMEYVRGQNLEEVMKKQKRFSVEQVLEVGSQVGHALSYLHGRTEPVFHLDIKPANIIWRRDGRLVLVDFGAAWKADSFAASASGRGTDSFAVSVTRHETDSFAVPASGRGMDSVADSATRHETDGFGVPATRYGTDGFAAPEQYDSVCPVDGRSDIYGLGATLYYLISGIRYSPLLRKSRIPGCPEGLGEIIKNCIQEEPKLRYQSSRQLCRAIAQYRRKERQKQKRYRFWLALLLAIFTAGLAFHEIPREFQTWRRQEWNYEQLLAEAACTAGEERRAYYERALFACPERKEAYLQYLRQVVSDGSFSKAEEEELRTWLHTIPLGKSETYEEALAEAPWQYGEVASELGMVYWYNYEGKDGKQIAAGWFDKAVAAGERGKMEMETAETGMAETEIQKPDWLVRAELYKHMGSYYGMLGRRDEWGENGNPAKKYWEDLIQLLELDVSEYGNPVTALRFFEEALNQLIFQAEAIHRAGVSKTEMLQKIDLIVRKAEQQIKSIQDTDREGIGELAEELAEKVLSWAKNAREVTEHLQMQEGD